MRGRENEKISCTISTHRNEINMRNSLEYGKELTHYDESIEAFRLNFQLNLGLR